MDHFISHNGDQTGPYSLDQLKDLLSNNKIKEQDLIWNEALEDWTPVSDWVQKNAKHLNAQEYKYKAFISYSHQDKNWGDWLHKALESFKIPKGLIGNKNNFGKVPKRLYPVFRDREELPTATELSSAIDKALRDSSHLIVICSPRSAQSQWVNEEIKQFKKLGKSDRILCLIIDGEPNANDKPESGQKECFPDAVKFKIGADGELSTDRTEPIAADARQGKDGKKHALLKLVAGLISVGFDDLKQRDLARRQKQMAAVAGICLILATVMGFLSLWALDKKKEAETARNKATIEQYVSGIFVADRSIKEGLVTQTKSILSNSPPAHRHWEWRYLKSLTDKWEWSVEVKSRNDSMSISPDGKYFITTSWENGSKLSEFKGIVQIRKTEDGSIIKQFEAHNDFTASAYYVDGGTKIATSTYGRDWTTPIKIWDASSGKLLFSIQYPKTVRKIALNNDKNIIAATSDDGIVNIYDINTQKLKLSFDGHKKDNRAGITIIWDIAFSKSGEHIYSYASTGELLIWETETGIIKKILRGEIGGYSKFSLSPDKMKLAVCLPLAKGISSLEIWSTDKLEKTLSTFVDYKSASISWSPDQNLIAAGGVDKIIRIHNASNGALLKELRGHEQKVSSLIFHPKKRLLFSGGTEGVIRLWDIKKSLQSVTLPLKGERVTDFDLSQNGEIAAIGSGTRYGWPKPQEESQYYGNVSIFNFKLNRITKSWKNDPERTSINSIKLSSDGNTVFTGDTKGFLKIWNAKNGKLLKTFKAQASIRSIVLSPDEKTIAAGMQNQQLQVWDKKTGNLLLDYINRFTQDPTQPLRAICFCPDGEILAAAFQGTLLFWNRSDGSTKTISYSKEITDQDYASAIDFSPDKKKLIVGGGSPFVDSRFLKIINPKDGNLIASLKGHEHPIESAKFSPDGSRIISCSGFDRTLKVWDSQTHREMMTATIAGGFLFSCKYSPDCKRVYAHNGMRLTVLK